MRIGSSLPPIVALLLSSSLAWGQSGAPNEKPVAPEADELAADTEELPATTEELPATTEETPPPTEREEPPAPAQDPSEVRARAAFKKGDRLFLEGDYEGAVDSFELAYALSGRIEMLFNLANAHERLGNYARASVALRGYIPHSPPETRTALERRLERFEALASQRRRKEEKTAEVVKELKENPRPFPVARTVGIGLLTLGSASIVAGTGFAISALGARAKLNNECEEGDSGRLCRLDDEKTVDRDRVHSTIADVALIGGILGATIGTVLIVRSKKKEKENLEMEISVAPGRLSLGGRF